MTNPRHLHDPGQPAYPIRTVCALTGLNPITLRAWERRYGFIEPNRTPGGHRLYTQEHVDQINRALSMLADGMPIGAAARAVRRSAAGSSRTDVWDALRSRAISAVTRFDESALDAIYESALGLQPIEAVARKLFGPVLEELGRRWESAEGRIAEEHFFTTYTRNKLGARLQHSRRIAPRARLLCACAPGEHHELGLLLFALAAHDQNVACVMLGANMPFFELAAACTQARCDGIVISMSVQTETPGLERDLREVVKSARGPVFVGGGASASHGDAITGAGGIPVGADIADGIRRLLATLGETQDKRPRSSR
jgi:MerR family transcriptional regulator, light-induced transcriptional regulator